MAQKRCPVCGKAVAAQAQYCIYCMTRFEGENSAQEHMHVNDEKKKQKQANPLALIVTLISLVLIALVVLLVLLGPKFPSSAPQEPVGGITTTVPAVTTTTRDASRDAWRQAYIGFWYDELSAGKNDLTAQGGYVLYIEEIFHEYITFSLTSYQAGGTGMIASADISKVYMQDDTIHFTFKNDTLGHSGEGHLRFADACIEMEVIIDGELAEDEHSLAINSIFKRRALPHSVGQDIKELTTLEQVMSVAGEQTAEVGANASGLSIYSFGGLKAVVDDDGAVSRLILDYSLEEDKAKYCYECVDGTMTYDTIKTYFGEALHDYVEQPTDIRVLHYEMTEHTKVTFTFDADNNILVYVDYIL